MANVIFVQFGQEHLGLEYLSSILKQKIFATCCPACSYAFFTYDTVKSTRKAFSKNPEIKITALFNDGIGGIIKS
jgi:hypothetical protein